MFRAAERLLFEREKEPPMTSPYDLHDLLESLRHPGAEQDDGVARWVVVLTMVGWAAVTLLALVW